MREGQKRSDESAVAADGLRVAAGVAWLDEHAPDWWRDLVPGTVPFTHRLYGQDHLWNYVYRELKVPYLRPLQRIDLGFDPGVVHSIADYNDLSDEWARVVRERHRQQKSTAEVLLEIAQWIEDDAADADKPVREYAASVASRVRARAMEGGAS